MKRGGLKGRRPEGTDGSDHSFRMTVEDRYKRLAETRMQLKKLLPVQTMYIVIRGIWAMVLLGNGRQIDYSVVIMLLLGASASWMGTMSLKGTRPYTLRFYVLFTIGAICFALGPMVTGKVLTTILDQYDEAEISNDYTNVCLSLVEAGQDFVGVATQVVVLFVASSMASAMARNKSPKSDYDRFMGRTEEDDKK